MKGLEHDRYERLVGEISARLRTVCAHLSDSDFSALVHDMARVSMRFYDIDRRPMMLRPLPDIELPVAPVPNSDAPTPPPPLPNA